MRGFRKNRNRSDKAFKFSPFSKKQRQVLNWWTDSSPMKEKEGIVADGAIRSGKTACMSLSFILWSMEKFDGENFAMCGKTIASFQRNVWKPLKRMLPGRGYKVIEHRTENMAEVSRNGVVNYYYFFGGKDESSQDLIQGITLAGLYCDEVALMPKSFFSQATARCSVEGSKWWMNCNPASPFHWFKVDWIDKADEKKLVVLHFSMDDNLSLSEGIKARYRSQYTGVFFKRYILGLWCMADGLIYDCFNTETNTKKISDIAPVLIDGQRYVSCDYGTQNATCFLLWNKGTDGVWYCVREYYYSGRDTGKQKTDSEYADDFCKWLEGTKIRSVIVDPAAASFIAELRDRHYPVIKANNDVSDGIRTVARLLSDKKICIASGCKNTISEFSTYHWDDKASERGEDKPVKEHDHAMDAVRYFCYTVINGKIARIGNKAKAGL